MTGPLVTIYIPTRGRPKLLRRAVQSALNQDYETLEVIVVLDGADQESELVLKELSRDARLSFFVLPESLGACQARNQAIQRASGTYVTGLDDDDQLLRHHVSSLVTTISRRSCAFVCTTALLRRKGGDQVRHVFSGPISLNRLLYQNIVGNQVLAPRQHFLEVGGFDPAMPAWQDYDLWVRLCERFGQGWRIDSRSYVQHIDHDNSRISEPSRIINAHACFVEKHAHLLSAKQRSSLELLKYATAHSSIPLRKVIEFMRAGLLRRTTSALVSEYLPTLRSFARR